MPWGPVHAAVLWGPVHFHLVHLTSADHQFELPVPVESQRGPAFAVERMKVDRLVPAVGYCLSAAAAGIAPVQRCNLPVLDHLGFDLAAEHDDFAFGYASAASGRGRHG